jgi:hypothetical protein
MTLLQATDTARSALFKWRSIPLRPATEFRLAAADQLSGIPVFRAPSEVGHEHNTNRLQLIEYIYRNFTRLELQGILD